VVQELLKHKPMLDVIDQPYGATILQTSLHEPAIVELLLDTGADLGLPNSTRNTLINSTVLNPNADVVKMLIEKKTNIHHPDSSGHTPIHAAVNHVRDASMVRLLTDAGAKLGKPTAVAAVSST
jgi:ankyrin repeat protein